jgi:S1-C subfamily serine protease
MRSLLLLSLAVVSSCRAPQDDGMKQVNPGVMSPQASGSTPTKPAESTPAPANPHAGVVANPHAATDKPTGSPGLNFMPGYGADVEGVLVENVRPGGAADKAGLLAGDVIVKFGGMNVTSVEEYMSALGTMAPGDKIEVVVKRGTETKTVKAEVGVSSR